MLREGPIMSGVWKHLEDGAEHLADTAEHGIVATEHLVAVTGLEIADDVTIAAEVGAEYGHMGVALGDDLKHADTYLRHAEDQQAQGWAEQATAGAEANIEAGKDLGNAIEEL